MNPVIARFLKRAALLVVVSFAAVYASDYLFLRLRMAYPKAGAAFGAATVYDETATKSGQMELFYNQPQIEVCVHSLFAHLGDSPCWVLARSPVKRVDWIPGNAEESLSADARSLNGRAIPAWSFPRAYAMMRGT